MKKYIALFLTLGFFAFLPSAVADDGTLAVDAPAHIRLPHNHNDNHTILTTLRVNNIQVKADWKVHSDSSLSLQISNGVLSIDEALTITQIVATVIVQDLFSDLNQAYENLSAQAVINIEIGYLFLSGPPEIMISAELSVNVELHTFVAVGDLGAKTYAIVSGNEANHFTLSNGGLLTALKNAPEGEYTLVIEVSDSAGNKATTTVTVIAQIDLFLSGPPEIVINAGRPFIGLYTYVAVGGSGAYTYAILSGNDANYFTLSNGGILRSNYTPAGQYTLVIEVSDSAGDKATTTITVTAQ